MYKYKKNRRNASNETVIGFAWFYLILVFAMLNMVFLSSCGRKKTPAVVSQPKIESPKPKTEAPKPKEPEAKQPIVEPPKVVLDFSATVQTLPEPNKYSVDLKWNMAGDNKNSFLLRQRGSEEIKKLREISERAVAFSDSEVVAGENYRYFLHQKVNNLEGLAGEAKVTVPKDLEIRDVSTEMKLSQFNRIFFFKSGKLLTSGAGVQFSTNEIVSDEGVIETFSPGSKSFPGSNGRSGGEISIVTNRFSGNLSIVGNGENAADGMDGGNGRNGNIGQNGQSGKWGMNPELYKYFLANFIDSFKIHMEKFNPLHTDPEWKFKLGGIDRYVCSTQPTNGTPGENGSAGSDGGDSGNGGSSTKIYVHIKEKTEGKINLVSEPGKGGLGGRPGTGGSGGLGGEPGELDRGHLCAVANNGALGSKGIDGHQGRVGEPGKRYPICLKISDQSYYDCNLFTEVKDGKSN